MKSLGLECLAARIWKEGAGKRAPCAVDTIAAIGGGSCLAEAIYELELIPIKQTAIAELELGNDK